MIRRLFLPAVSLAVLIAQPPPPPAPRVTIHTQVREDIFAGFMANDMARFQVGLEKIDKILAENPNSQPAMAWRGGAELYLAVRAHEAGKKAEFAERYAKSRELSTKTLTSTPRDGGAIITSGASLILFADRLPEPQRTEAYRVGRDAFREVEKMQAQVLDRLPVHMKGELLAGLAQANQRLGDAAESRQYLERIVNTMAGTPYESRAKKWIEQPPLASKSSLLCLTCHEPGRLENVLKAQAQPAR